MERRLYGPGAVVGVLALAVGLAAAEVTAGVVRGAPTPVVAVGEAVIDTVPAPVKDWAIATFGTANKPVLVAGVLLVVVVAAVGVGMAAVRGRRRAALMATGALGVIALWAAATGPTPAGRAVAPTSVGLVAAMVVVAALPPAMRSARQPSVSVSASAAGDRSAVVDGSVAARAAPAVVPMGVDRRRVVGGTLLLGTGALATGGLGRLLQRRFEVGAEREALALPSPRVPARLPADVDFGGGSAGAPGGTPEGLTPFVTPTADFFRIDTALTVPQVSVDEWHLRIHGMVERELDIDFADLLRREQVERYVTISCVSNEVGGNLIGNARWQGVLLADVLREAGVDPAAEQLVSRSIDGWTCGTPVSAVLDGRDALLAIGMNGSPLPPRHGYPVRMVVPGLFGYVSATKWVTDIELTTWDAFDAYWTTRGWAEQAPVKTMTRIDRPRRRSRWPAGPLDLAGVAWAVHRGISAVEIRIDDGEWLACELAGVPSDDTWRQWRLRWIATPGDHVVEARAVDGQGVPQPAEPRPVAPDGAQGYHRISFTVT